MLLYSGGQKWRNYERKKNQNHLTETGKKKKKGDGEFVIKAAKLWDKLPEEMRLASSHFYEHAFIINLHLTPNAALVLCGCGSDVLLFAVSCIRLMNFAAGS